jgi:hypothetical protein
MHTYKRALLIITLVAFAAGAAWAAASAFTISYGPAGSLVSVKKNGDGDWTATEGGAVYRLLLGADGKTVFSKAGATIATGRLSGESLNMAAQGGGFYMAVTIQADAVRLSAEQGGAPWTIAKITRETKIDDPYLKMQMELAQAEGRPVETPRETLARVERGGVEQGTVRLYAETGRLKAADATGEIIAQMKDTRELSLIPAPFAIKGLSEDKRDFLMLLLAAMGK